MKFIKGLLIVFAVSIVCAKTGISAWTYTVYNTALKSLSGTTDQAELYKSSLDNQILEIDEVYKDRSIKFKIAHLLDSGWDATTWQSVNISGNYPVILQINGGMMQELYAKMPGNKKLSMKTSGIHIGVTGLYGVWWVSEADYKEYLSVL